MGKTDSSGSHIHNGSQIEIVMFVFKSATQSPPILMTGHTIHQVLLSVQEKAFPGYYLILTHPERLHHFIDYFSVCHQPADNFIKIRIFTSLPEMWVLQFKSGQISLCPLRTQVKRPAVCTDFSALLRINGVFECYSSRLKSGIIQFHFYGDIGRFLRYILLGDVDTRRGTIGNRYVILFGYNQPYGTINTAVDTEKVLIDRNYIGTGFIVGFNNDFILGTEFERCTYFACKGRITTFVRTCQFPVDIHFGTGSYPFETQKNTLTLQVVGKELCFAVVACPFVERARLYLHIHGIPGMWNFDRFPLSIPLGGGSHRICSKRTFLKLPAGIESRDLTCHQRNATTAQA